MVLSNKSLTNIAHCVLDSADKTNLSRFFSQAPWLESAVNKRRISYLLEQTVAIRESASEPSFIRKSIPFYCKTRNFRPCTTRLRPKVLRDEMGNSILFEEPHIQVQHWVSLHILTTYLQRWLIETFYQDSKSHLGLDEYRMRNTEALGKHWCLVFVAYSFLHLDCLPPSLTKASLPIKTIGEACRQQAQALIENLILYAHDRLQQGQSPQNILTYLFAKQQWVAT